MGRFGLHSVGAYDSSDDSESDDNLLNGRTKPLQFRNVNTSRRGRIFASPALSDSTDEDDAYTSDSEEEQFPVSDRRHALKVAQDDWDIWNRLEGEAAAKSAEESFGTTLREELTLQVNAARKSQLASLRNSETELGTITKMLESMELKQAEEKKRVVAEFERRNKELWDNINATIETAEKEAAAALAAAKKKQEEQELKARIMREKEEKKIKEEAEKKRLEAEANAKKAQDEKKLKDEQEEKNRVAQAIAEKNIGADKEWRRWRNRIDVIKRDILPAVTNNAEWKKECSTAKRLITRKIGQLTNESAHILQTTATINSSLIQLKSTSSEAYTWGLNHLSKALIKQAELEVTAKISFSYPLAHVVAKLLGEGHVELGEILMARIVKKCFWVSAFYPPKQPGMTSEEHDKLLGQRPNSSETSDQYQLRMSGIVAFWAAVIQTEPSGPVDHYPEWLRPKQGWKWLSLILRQPIASLEAVPLLVEKFLSVSGERFFETYGKQFVKVVKCLLEQGIVGKQAGFKGNRAGLVKLQIMLEQWVSTGRVKGADGRIMDT